MTKYRETTPVGAQSELPKTTEDFFFNEEYSHNKTITSRNHQYKSSNNLDLTEADWIDLFARNSGGFGMNSTQNVTLKTEVNGSKIYYHDRENDISEEVSVTSIGKRGGKRTNKNKNNWMYLNKILEEKIELNSSVQMKNIPKIMNEGANLKVSEVFLKYV
jgi:hypothetical protein